MKKDLTLHIQTIDGEKHILPLSADSERWARMSHAQQDSLVLIAMVSSGIVETWITEEK